MVSARGLQRSSNLYASHLVMSARGPRRSSNPYASRPAEWNPMSLMALSDPRLEEEMKKRPRQMAKDVEEKQEEYEMRVFKLALPMRSKEAKEVTRASKEIVLKLKMDGTMLVEFTARGHEFLGTFETWMKSRGTLLTWTSGDDPRANGRAEVTVKTVKNQLRRVLMHAGVDSQWWPWALWYLNEVFRCQCLDKLPDFPRFLQEVLVRKRRWTNQAFEPTVEVARFLGPAPEDNGHWIKVDGEAPRVTRCVTGEV